MLVVLFTILSGARPGILTSTFLVKLGFCGDERLRHVGTFYPHKSKFNKKRRSQNTWPCTGNYREQDNKHTLAALQMYSSSLSRDSTRSCLAPVSCSKSVLPPSMPSATQYVLNTYLNLVEILEELNLQKVSRVPAANMELANKTFFQRSPF